MGTTYLTGTYSVIHTNTTADFDKYVYSAVYFNSGSTYTINGASVTGVAGKTLDNIIDGSTTTLSAGFLLLGNLKAQGVIPTGLITATGGTEQYQFVNIKTGLPTNG